MVMLFMSGEIEFQLWWISQAIRLSKNCRSLPLLWQESKVQLPSCNLERMFQAWCSLREHWTSFLPLTPAPSIVFTLDKFYSPCRTGKLSLRMVPDHGQSKSTWSNCFCDRSKWLGSRVRRGRLALLAGIARLTGPMTPHTRWGSQEEDIFLVLFLLLKHLLWISLTIRAITLV